MMDGDLGAFDSSVAGEDFIGAKINLRTTAQDTTDSFTSYGR